MQKINNSYCVVKKRCSKWLRKFFELLIIFEDVAKELEEKYKIETRVIAVDFTEPDSVHNKISEGIKVIYNYIHIYRPFQYYFWLEFNV